MLSTGDELVSGDTVADGGHIHDANRPALLAQVAADGFQAVDLAVVGDDESELSASLDAAARRCDVIVASGGVSVGDHDALKVVLGKLGGGSMQAMDVAVKPGRHVAFAQIGPKFTLTFGLPGNPVAALVAYQLFVRPALRAMAGHVRLGRPRLSAIAAADLRRRLAVDEGVRVAFDVFVVPAGAAPVRGGTGDRVGLGSLAIPRRECLDTRHRDGLAPGAMRLGDDERLGVDEAESIGGAVPACRAETWLASASRSTLSGPPATHLPGDGLEIEVIQSPSGPLKSGIAGTSDRTD